MLTTYPLPSLDLPRFLGQDSGGIAQYHGLPAHSHWVIIAEFCQILLFQPSLTSGISPMPRNVIGAPPYTIQTLDSDRPIVLEDITPFLNNEAGVSFCIRSVNGHEKRGGYFFHIKKNLNLYCISDFEKSKVWDFDAAADLVRFINHVSGRRFDLDMFKFCQDVVNLRQDQNRNG